MKLIPDRGTCNRSKFQQLKAFQPQMIPFDHGSTLEEVGNADGHRFHDPPDSTAIYGSKKPMNTGLTGYFSQTSQVEPGGISTPLKPSAITGISEADALMVPMMATLFPMLDPLGASRNQVCFNLLLRDEIGAAASTFSESPKLM